MFKNLNTQKKKGYLSNSNTLFKIESATVSFGKNVALKNINLSIEKGDFLFITGASGAGKTTFLRMLAGEIDPSSGSATSHNRNSFVGQVFQDIRLVGHLTLYENLLLTYDPSLFVNRNEFLLELDELAKVLGCHDRLTVMPKNANGGLKQKVAIIRALLSRPDILVADEPTSSLDFENAKKLYDVFNFYNLKKGICIVWATHNRELVRKFKGKIIHLDKGKLVHTGHACFI